MTTISEKGVFKLWDYRTGHRQLLLRRPGTRAGSLNHDIIFRGVLYVSLPSSIEDPHIRPATPPELDRGFGQMGRPVDLSFVHVVAGRSSWGFVVAEAEPKQQTNTLDMFETSLEPWSDSQAAAEYYERQVVLALAELSPTLQPRHLNENRTYSQLDAILTRNDRSIGVEAHWISDQRTPKAVQAKVRNLAQRLMYWQQTLDGVLLVVNIQHPSWMEEFEIQLAQALPGTQVRAATWTSDADTPALLETASDMLFPSDA